MILTLVFALISAPAYAVKPCGRPTSPPQPCSPDITQRRDILVLIGNTTGYHQAWLEAQAEEQRLRRLILKGKSEDYAAWNRSAGRAQAAMDKLNGEFELVVKKTEDAYRVGPDSRSDGIHGGLFEGDVATWKPTLGVEEAYFKVERPKKPPIYLRFENKENAKELTLAQLLDDGRVVVSIHALQLAAKTRNPATFAAVLEHEGVHFDRLLSAEGMVGHAANETAAYRRELEVADDIGLGREMRDNAKEHIARHTGDLVLQGVEATVTGKPYRAKPGSEDYPYVPTSDHHFKGWEQYRARLSSITRQQDALRDNFARVNRGQAPERLRDSLNDRRPPPAGATTHDGCSGTGFWAGDVYFPAAPCGQALPPPADTSAAPAVPAPAVPGATLPPPVRGIVSLSGLAERICASPAQAHAQAFHDDYKNSWVNPKDDPAAMPKCQGEVFRVLKQIAGNGAADYNSAYFQALADSLNAPQPAPFVPPEPEVDYPVPYGPGVPDCMLGEGRRCIRWRR